MALNPEMRASDADRDRIAEALREHCAQGRITLDELHERLTDIYRARTFGELEQVTVDLPEQDLHEMPTAVAPRPAPAAPAAGNARWFGPVMKANWVTYVGVNALCFTIWLITVVASGSMLYPWFLWVAGPWGAVLLTGQLFGPRRR